MRMRASTGFLLALAVLPALLAGCTGSPSGGATPQIADCSEPMGNYIFSLHVDQAHPEPGKAIMVTANVSNIGRTDVPTPANFTIQIAPADTKAVVLQWANFTPRFDMPSTIPANSSLFLRRIGGTLPGTVIPGSYVVCGVTGSFRGMDTFTVYPRAYSTGSS